MRSFRHQTLEDAMDDLKNRGQPDRSKINMHEAHEVKYWTKELGVDKDKLQKTVDKVGNSAAAVRKELAA
jgi:3-oxoacyl-[acyl-carrier-protein] synthase III